MIKTTLLLFISFIAMFTIYYIYLPSNKIVALILSEYIIFTLIFAAFIVQTFFKRTLKNKTIVQYIQDTKYVPIKSTLLLFLVFQGMDFYFEGGFIGMISMWFMYWVFAILAILITSNMNYYKNYKAYKKAS